MGSLLAGLAAVMVAPNLPATAADWPQWRGPSRSGLSEEIGLLKTWPEGGPTKLWTVSGVGNGYASVSISEGLLFTTGYIDEQEMLICLRAETGQPVWSVAIGPASAARQRRPKDGKAGRPKARPEDPAPKPAEPAPPLAPEGPKADEPRQPPSIGYPGSRCTPTVDGGRVYALSSLGDLLCAEKATGLVVWKRDLRADFAAKVPFWGFGESPLVDGDRLLCCPNAPNVAMVALNKNTGQTLWTSAGKSGGAAGYASMVVAEIAGVRQYVQLMGKGVGVVGIRAADGQRLWNYDRISNGTANIPTPVVFGDHVFATSGYNDGGSALVKIVARGDANKDGPLAVEEVWYKEAKQLQNHHGGVLLIGEHLYFGHGHNNGFPVCVELLSGRIVWGGQTRGPGTGSAAVAYADGRVIFRYQNHVVAMFEATPQGPVPSGQFNIPEGQRESWPHPVIANGRLYLRNQDQLLCYDVRAAQADTP